MKKIHILYFLKFLVAGVFVLSAIAKMFPLWAFEKQLVDLNICDWCYAPYFARFIIGLELALGMTILQRNLIRKLIVPVTAILLITFCIHLAYQMYQYGPMNGNCGCFGQLIPMTPLEALIKNIITLAVLFFIFKLTPEDEPMNAVLVTIVWLLSLLIMFVFFPFCPCQGKVNLTPVAPVENEQKVDSIQNIQDTATVIIIPKEAPKQDTVAKIEIAPRAVKSIFASFNSFSGQSVNLDEGKKIVCMYNPNCDHCLETATRMARLAKTMKLPPIYVIFLNEETQEIPNFYANSGGPVSPYTIVEPRVFFTLSNGAFPAVYYLWNGNVVGKFEGDKESAFTEAKMRKLLLKSNSH